jgi:hypothetical protein
MKMEHVPGIERMAHEKGFVKTMGIYFPDSL